MTYDSIFKTLSEVVFSYSPVACPLPKYFVKQHIFLSILWLCFLFVPQAYANEKHKRPTPNFLPPSTNLMGTLGLNTIPSARMDNKGTARIGVSTTDPYLHSFIGFQLAEPLYVNIRQSAEISGLNDSARRLYPGIDFKLRLMEETHRRPEISFGINSAFGHKRFSSEYFVFSKRINNFDLTGGLAWGQLAGKGHIKNPFHAFSSHFEQDRDYTSNISQNYNDWFTGKKIGFFGGVEYFTPLKGLSLKADWNAQDYSTENQTITNFKSPDPWSISLNYKPKTGLICLRV